MSISNQAGRSSVQPGLFRTVSESESQYTEAIVAGGFENEAISVYPTEGSRLLIQNIVIASVDNLAWTLWFWADATFETGGFLNSRIDFAVADGRQIGGAGFYFYDLHTVSMENPYPFPYVLNAIPSPVVTTIWNNGLLVGLENRSGVAKTAGANTFALNIMYSPDGEVG